MSSAAMQSNVGNPQVYEDGDQSNASSNQFTGKGSNIGEQGQKNAHNIFDPKDSRNLDVRAQQERKEEREAEREERARTIDDPLEPAKRHGNDPSRGAQIDAELQREDEENIKKKGLSNDSSY
ncbi:hypothetical protein C8Q79DRAFT_1005785 [Trametes meyenii]|nr:hypothetical protein C8Q79DRAFT_1005785 [Trametes meyenii]